MNLSLRINSPEDESGTNDSDSNNTPDYPEYNYEKIAEVLGRELEAIYPDAENYELAEISLSFVSAEEIRELNKAYRDTDESTDVLSFPIDDDMNIPVLMLGDIVICPEETQRLHPELSPRDALCLMIAHSFLHLLGYDHDTDEKQKSMWELQEAIAEKLREAA